MATETGFSRKNLAVILLVLLLILSAALVYFQYSNLRNLRAEVEEEERALSAAKARLERYLEHQQNAGEYEQRLAYARRLIPQEPGEDVLLRYIYRLAAQYDLKSSEIRFGNRVERENFSEMPLVVTVEGNYQDLRRFLRHLRDGGERAVRVDNMRISRMGDADPGIRTVISAGAFYRQEN